MTAIPGTRGRNQPLTQSELVLMRKDLAMNLRVNYIAGKYGCSSRVVQKYKAIWFGGNTPRTYACGNIRRTPWHSKPKEQAPATASHEPNCIPSITKAMLMGGRAPVAKTVRT